MYHVTSVLHERVFLSILSPMLRLLSLGRDREKVPGIWDETDARWELGRKTDKQHVGYPLPSALFFLRLTFGHSLYSQVGFTPLGGFLVMALKGPTSVFIIFFSLGPQTFQGDKISTCCSSLQPKSKNIALGFMYAELFFYLWDLPKTSNSFLWLQHFQMPL